MKKSSVVFCLVYLFTYFQLAPAFESIKWEHEKQIENKESTDLIPISSHLRSKRFLVGFLITVFAGIVSNVIGGIILNAITGGRWGRNTEDKNPEMINKMINNDMKGAMEVKTMMMKMDPNVGKMLEVSENGFSCDAEFCETRDGLFGMGLCTPYACRCKNHEAISLTCKAGRMFDPATSRCASSMKIAVCGH